MCGNGPWLAAWLILISSPLWASILTAFVIFTRLMIREVRWQKRGR